MLVSPLLALSLLRLPLGLALPHQDYEDDVDEDWMLVRELYEADAAQAMYISPLMSYADPSDRDGSLGDEDAQMTSGESYSSAINDTGTTNSTKTIWACDVRSWVRAPDMAPGITVPAEVRLAMNGSACAEVESWSVGLALKERGVLKVRAPGAVFPIQPQWSDEIHGRPGSIYTDSLYDDFSYDQEYRKYQAALADPALWIVKGVERVAFDAKVDMPVIQNPTDVDVVVPFYAHCPDTNLPPVLDGPRPYVEHGSEGEFINAESIFNYRILLHLSNGTTIEQVAGQAGFTPRPKPKSQQSQSVEETQHGLLNTRRPTEGREDRWDPAPACDRGKLARFNVSVTTQSIAVAGTNHTFNLQIRRLGNGSEYPSNIDLSFGIESNHTWALAYIDSDTFLNATRSNEPAYGSYTTYLNRIGGYARMLSIKSDAMLQLEKEMTEKRSEMMRDARQSRGAPPYGVRVELQGEKEVYDVEVELPIPEDVFPSFERTLEQHLPTVQMRLNTYFACAKQTDDDPASQSAQSTQKRKVDDEWQEYSLPVAKNKTTEEYEMQRYMDHHHRGTGYLTIVGSAPLVSDIATEHETAAKHYLDPTALAPVLSLSATRPAPDEFPLLDQELAQEAIEDMRETKYSWPTNKLLCANQRAGSWDSGCWAHRNAGGFNMHAARVWQRKERSEGEVPVAK